MIESLPRREREIFEILCRGAATAAQVREQMKDAPSSSAVRTLLTRLEAKGLASHSSVDGAYLYKSVARQATVRNSALKQIVQNFFGGSAASAATALLGLTQSLSPAEAEELRRAIDQARERQS